MESRRADETAIDGRGIRLDALQHLFDWADQRRETLNRRASEHSWAYFHLDNERIPPPPEYDVIPQDQTAHDFVRHFGNRLTASSKSSLHEIVLKQYVGKPDVFISYAWDSVLINKADGLIPTLNFGEPEKIFVWIDIVCHNQHQVGSIADQMRAVISRCDRMVIPMMAPWYERAWCMWEVYCAKLEDKPIHFQWAPKLSRRFKAAYRKYAEGFVSVSESKATYQRDKDAILRLIENEFGTIREADDFFRSIMNEV